MQQSISSYPGTSYDGQHHAGGSHHRQSQPTSAKGCGEEHQTQGDSQHESSVVSKSRSTPSPGPVFSSVASVTPPLVSQVVILFLKVRSVHGLVRYRSFSEQDQIKQWVQNPAVSVRGASAAPKHTSCGNLCQSGHFCSSGR